MALRFNSWFHKHNVGVVCLIAQLLMAVASLSCKEDKLVVGNMVPSRNFFAKSNHPLEAVCKTSPDCWFDAAFSMEVSRGGVVNDDILGIYEHARSLFDSGFGEVSPREDHRYASLLDNGTGGPRDIARAAFLYNRSCRGGLALSCIRMIDLVHNEEGLDRTFIDEGYYFSLAISILKGECERMVGESCHDIGFMYDVGRGCTKDRSLAMYYYYLACSYGFGWACSRIASMLEEM